MKKEELLEILPKPKDLEVDNDEIKRVEKFFRENEELQKIIKPENEIGKYFVSYADLKKFQCPIKKSNKKDYWEAFFILLGFEFCIANKRGGAILIIR